jgi:thiamine-monophosphate kinase
MTDAPLSKELAIIDLIAQMTGQAKPLADDAFWDPVCRRIYTTDMLVEGRHFDLAYFSPQDLGWKAAAVNISDIAAMGGQLQYLLVSLGLPDAIDLDWIRALYQGLGEACQRFGGQIAGGDTVGSDRLVINVTAVGTCPVGHTPGHRYAAQAGDYLVATGFHGLSHVGMQALQAEISGYEACKASHLRPMPRVEAGLLLSSQFERYALMDSSDGLADALLKMAQASGKSLVAKATDIPLHPELLAYANAQGWNEQQQWQAVLYGGEDFELVAAVPSLNEALLQQFHVFGRVEETKDAPGAWLQLGESGARLPLSLNRTYQHFEVPGHVG